MRRLICKKINDEFPYQVRFILNNNNEYYGIGKTIGGAIKRIEHLSGININYHIHKFNNMDICEHCEISKKDISAMYKLIEQITTQKL